MTDAVLHPIVEAWDDDLAGDDPLAFPGYAEEIAAMGGRESVLTGRTDHYALIAGRFDVFGGSMGAVHGERVVRAFRRAADAGLPVVVVTSSGGARMQEGMVSLIQMARTAAAVNDHAARGLLSLAVHRSPTTGGVFASYGSLCDVRAAEPGATIGFAGPRVVERTLGHAPPAGSHRSERAYEAGLVDALVARDEQPAWVEAALGLRAAPLLLPEGRLLRSRSRSRRRVRDVLRLRRRRHPWESVRRARAPGRPSGIDWAARLCESWTDLHGPDPTVRAGIATLAGTRLVVVASDRYAGDGRPTPAGFRLAQRAIALAGRLRLPLLTLVDTPGAHPGSQSEEGGIAGEIARTFAAMEAVPTASVSVCVGEGGSGGALAIAAADRLLVQRDAIFSVIAPEGAAAILGHEEHEVPDLAARLRITSKDLADYGIADAVVPEDADGLRAVIVDALAGARPGDRQRRFDAATARWLRG